MNTTRRNGAWGRVALMAIACSPALGLARADGDVEGPWTLGHGDLSVGYDSAAQEFEFEVHLHTGAVVDGATLDADAHGSPAEISIVVPRSANLRRIDDPTGFFDGGFDGYDFTPATFDATGAAVDGDLWVLGGSADASFYGTPFVGLGAEELAPADWTGTVSYVLQSVSFDGSDHGTSGGILSFFSEALQPLWSSQDGFSQIPISLIPGAGHEHGYFFFSQPGIYEMTLGASGTHVDDGPITGTGTFRFEVVPEPSGLLLAGLGLCATIGVGLRRRKADGLRAGRLRAGRLRAGRRAG